MLAAFEAGDVNHYAALVERNVERAELARRAPSCCIFCHSLQVVTPTGFAFCPYRDPGNHARAREFNLGGEYEAISGSVSRVSTVEFSANGVTPHGVARPAQGRRVAAA